MARMDEATSKRVRAGRMMLAGKTPAEAAKAVGVARQTAYTWKAHLHRSCWSTMEWIWTRQPLAKGSCLSHSDRSRKRHAAGRPQIIRIDCRA